MTTFADWIDSLEDIPIVGVMRRHTQGPPLSVSTADLPCSYVSLPKGDAVSVACGPTWQRTLRADLVVLLEPVGQNVQPANFNATTGMMDAITDALADLEAGASLLDGPMSITITLAIVEVAKTTFWGVVCNISGLG